jgi:hypothetical protein
MNQALYAHMSNKRKMKKKNEAKSKRTGEQQSTCPAKTKGYTTNSEPRCQFCAFVSDNVARLINHCNNGHANATMYKTK